MDALKHKVHTAYKVREPNPRSLHPNKPSSPPPPAPPSIFFVSFQTRVPDTDVHVVDSRASPPPRLLQGVAESLMTTRTTSAFLEKGVVTPEEFVVAGDYLVEQCPTWSWQGGDAKSAKSYLPEDKQFLVTRNVPCLKRARAMEEYAGKEQHLSGEDEGWVAAGGDGNGASKDDDAPDMDEIPDISALRVDSGAKDDKNDDDDDDAEDIPDMDDFDMCGDEEDDASALPSSAAPLDSADDDAGHILKTRTYDLSITYDKYYQTPRVWLNGYDERRRALDPKKALEDISAEHAKKTVTIDPHPHTSVPSASIHPCKHAPVMKKLIESAAGDAEPSVERYLFVFLKFIASVVPTIEYDYTASASLR